MPTPSGMLKAGDRLWHDTDRGIIYRVVSRSGNSLPDYSVILEREDQRVLPPSSARLSTNLKQMRLTEAHYWVFMHRTGWHLVEER